MVHGFYSLPESSIIEYVLYKVHSVDRPSSDRLQYVRARIDRIRLALTSASEGKEGIIMEKRFHDFMTS